MLEGSTDSQQNQPGCLVGGCLMGGLQTQGPRVVPLSSHRFTEFYCLKVRAREEEKDNCYVVNAQTSCQANV